MNGTDTGSTVRLTAVMRKALRRAAEETFARNRQAGQRPTSFYQLADLVFGRRQGRGREQFAMYLAGDKSGRVAREALEAVVQGAGAEALRRLGQRHRARITRARHRRLARTVRRQEAPDAA